jgi:hypothetical protein
VVWSSPTSSLPIFLYSTYIDNYSDTHLNLNFVVMEIVARDGLAELVESMFPGLARVLLLENMRQLA